MHYYSRKGKIMGGWDECRQRSSLLYCAKWCHGLELLATLLSYSTVTLIVMSNEKSHDLEPLCAQN